MTSILWFRQDLRLHDNPALVAACAEGDVIPVYILDPAAQMGGASLWWLHHSLLALQKQLPGLMLRRGPAASELLTLAAQTGVERVHANRHYEPRWRESESEMAAEIDLVSHHGNQLADPATLLTGGGGRYKVFTPWWRNLLEKMPPRKPLAVPEQIATVAVSSETLSDWNLLPTQPNWATGFDVWTPGEVGARQALRGFLPKIETYDESRNLPSEEGISRLSPHLHFGEISPATIWHVASKQAGLKAEPFLREVGWRDYATNLIDQFPDYATQNGRAASDRLPDRKSDV